MRAVLDLFGRVIAGPFLILLGSGMLAGLLLISMLPTYDVFGLIAIVIAVEAYAIVAVLFVLTGLHYTLGPKSWIQRMADDQVRSIGLVVITGTLAVVVGFLIAIL